MADSSTLDKIGDIAEELLDMAPTDPKDFTPDLYERMRDKVEELKPLKDDLEVDS